MTTVSENQLHEHMDAMDGYCTTCKKWTAEGVEPDAEGYECPVCEQPTVLGAENALCHGTLDVRESKAPSPSALLARAVLDPTPDAKTRALDAIVHKAAVCRNIFCAGGMRVSLAGETKCGGAILDVRKSVLVTAVKDGRDVGAGLVMCGLCWDAGADAAHQAAEKHGATLRVYDPRRKGATRKRK